MIELLTVLAIVATLTALVVPAVSSGIRSARKVSDLSQLRQIGVALNVYANDNNQFFPAAWNSTTQQTWAAQLGGFSASELSARKSLFVSPLADPLTATDNQPYNITYSMHGLLGLEEGDPLRKKSIQVQRPSEVILIANGYQVESNFNRASSTIYAPGEIYWEGNDYPLDRKFPTAAYEGTIAYPNGQAVSAVFVDGHAASIKKGDVVWGNFIINR